MGSSRTSGIIFAACSAIFPFILYLTNATRSLGFADTAEFALVTKLLSTAHPPGFPAYVLTGHLWSIIVSPLTGSHVDSMILFSALCSAAAGALIFLSAKIITSELFPDFKQKDVVALAASGAFSYGSTVWYWSNSVEVYSLQAMAVALAGYGILLCRNGFNRKAAVMAGVGIGIGLSNHHLTMILLVPFLSLLTYPGMLKSAVKNTGGKKKSKQPGTAIQWLPLPKTLLTTGFTALFVCVVFYGWMYFNAGKDFAFEFGNPDNPSRLLYHLAGGAWMKNTAQEVSGIVGMRFPYFMKLVWWQYLPFLPFLIAGLYWILKSGLYRFSLYAAGYFIVILAYQLRIDQTSDTDAYLIPAFAVMAPLVAAGTAAVTMKWKKALLAVPVLLVVHAATGYSRTDKRDFNVSESLMKMLDESAPENAVILISDWTLVIQYHYYRIAENFRPDLTVLNYDLKFTNYKSIPVMYPEFYKEMGPWYDRFVSALGAAHPQEIYNTGCTLDSPELMNIYRETVLAIQKYCEKHNKDYLVDPKAFVFQIQNGMMTSESRVSGCFVSKKETGIGIGFLDLPFRWLDSPITLTEPAATDKLVDFEAMLDFHRNYYRSAGDQANLAKAEAGYMRIKVLQRKVKQHLPFVFRKD